HGRWWLILRNGARQNSNSSREERESVFGIVGQYPVFAFDYFPDFDVGTKREIDFTFERPGISLGIVESNVEMDGVVINTPDAFYNVEVLAMRMTAAIQPGLIV